ncbi:MAG: Abi family protein, partial [Lachnospiraceae bacterium]|nr:Abi family protein [Lachnospiraceae bacterium]
AELSGSAFLLLWSIMMELKPPLTIEEQLDELSRHHIQIDDPIKAREILTKVGYYRLSGYWLKYKYAGEDTTLSQVYCVYAFDEELRSLLRRYIEITEMFYKNLIGTEFALLKCKEPPHNQHYDEANYYDKKGIRATLDRFEKERQYYRESNIVKHHKAKYANRMPLWVMMELMTYSSMSMFYNALYISDKEKISGKIGVSYKTLENHLHCLSVLRNKCAHGARIYGTKITPPARFTKSFLKSHSQISNDSLFAYVLVLIKRLPTDAERKAFRNQLNRLLKKYETQISLSDIGFPEDYRKVLYLKNLNKIE